MRKPLSKLQRVKAFDKHNGVCSVCSLKILIGQEWDLDHKVPLWLGGADDESNMAPAHIHCHAEKTGEESGTRSKTDRIREKHLGIKPKRKWKWG